MNRLPAPTDSKRKDLGNGYASLSENLIEFNKLGALPFPLDEGQGIKQVMTTNAAQYHWSCQLKYNNTKLQRAAKRVLCANSANSTDSEDNAAMLANTESYEVQNQLAII